MRARQLQILTFIVCALVALDGLFTPVIMLWAYTLPDSYQSIVTPVAGTVDGSALVLRLATMILFGRWIYVAGTNAIAMGHDTLNFTPAARIWWFAVPFANLIKPVEGMRELWNASHGEAQYDRNHGLIALWWTLWLAAGFFTTFLSFSMRSGDPGVTMWAIDSALGLGLAGAAIALIWEINRAQQQPVDADMAEVFA